MTRKREKKARESSLDLPLSKETMIILMYLPKEYSLHVVQVFSMTV